MEKRQMIPAAGLGATIAAAVYMVVQLHGQTAQQSADLTNAALAEVRDAEGRAILNGQFQPVEDDDDDIERKATLAPTGIDADATGEAEIEFRKSAPAEQEIEFSVRNVEPGAVLAFVIDGTEVATATVGKNGRAEIDVDVRLSGTTTSR